MQDQSPFLSPVHPAIAAVIKVSLAGIPSLIGSGFFISTNGLFVTAKHVIRDNMNNEENEIGGIGALLLDANNFGQYLPLVWSSWHPVKDIAVSDTRPRFSGDGQPITTECLPLSIVEPAKGSTITSRFFCHSDRAISDKDLVLREEPRTIVKFELEHIFLGGQNGTPYTTAGFLKSLVGSQDRTGQLRKHYRPVRDSVMLPFPVFESDLAIPGSGSGGPVFNELGKVIGINTTGIPGSDISHHTSISELLELQARVTVSGSPEHYLARVGDLARTGRLPIEGVDADPTMPLGVDYMPSVASKA